MQWISLCVYNRRALNRSASEHAHIHKVHSVQSDLRLPLLLCKSQCSGQRSSFPGVRRLYLARYDHRRSLLPGHAGAYTHSESGPTPAVRRPPRATGRSPMPCSPDRHVQTRAQAPPRILPVPQLRTLHSTEISTVFVPQTCISVFMYVTSFLLHVQVCPCPTDPELKKLCSKTSSTVSFALLV